MNRRIKASATALLSFAYFSSPSSAGPEDITELREIKSETVLAAGGEPRAAIVYPGPPADDKEAAYWRYADPDGTSEAYGALAARVAEAVERASGIRLPLIRADEYAGEGEARNLILLGRMNNNAVAFDLYVERRIATDDWFPGPGGFVSRTVTDPWGDGTNVILLGGSDIGGVERAVEYFINLDVFGGQALTLTAPRQWKINFAGMDEHAEAFADVINAYYREIVDEDSPGFRSALRAAEGYFITGCPEYVEAFTKLMDTFMPADWDALELHSRPAGHHVAGGMEKYAAGQIGPLYAAIEDSPHLSDDFRLRMVNWLYKTFWQWCGHDFLRDWGEGELRILDSWNRARVPASRGEYFRRYYPEVDLSRYDMALENIRNALEAMSRDYNLFPEMGGYTQLGPSIMFELMLRYGWGKTEFFESGNGARFLDFLIQRTNLRGDRGPLSGLGGGGSRSGWLYPVLYYKQPEYAWILGSDPGRRLRPRLTADELHYELWNFIPNMLSREPEHMTGLRRTGISEVAYPDDAGVPRERAYRMLTMRTGFDPDSDQYFLMYGTGRYGGGSVNSASLEHGRRAADESFEFTRNASGIDFGSYSELSSAAELGRVALVRSVAPGCSLDWSRDVLWRIGGGWLIIDRLAVTETGDYRLQSEWKSREWRDPGPMNIQRAAAETQYSGKLAAGDEYVFATLIAGGEDYSLRRVTDSLYVLEQAETVAFAGSSPFSGKNAGSVALADGAEVTGNLFYVSPGELYVAGLRGFSSPSLSVQAGAAVDLAIDFESARVLVDACEPVRLTFSGMSIGDSSSLEVEEGRHEFEAAFGAGVKDSVSALVASVREMPETPVAYESVEIEYPLSLAERWRYELGDTAPYVIEAADLDGNGRQDVLLGLEDGRVIRLSPEGEKLWEFTADGDMSEHEGRGGSGPVWARSTHTINAITTADFGEGMRVLVTSTDMYVYCLDAATGEVDWKFTGRGMELEDRCSTGVLASSGGPMWAVNVADINGDGKKEVLVGGHAHSGRYSGRIWVLDSSGQLRWQRFMEWVTAVSQIAVFDPENDGRKHIAVAGHMYPHARRIYVFDHEGNQVPFRIPGRYFHLATGNAGVEGAERLLTLSIAHGPVLKAFSPDPSPPSPAWVYGFPFAIWRYELSGTPHGFIVTDLDGNGIEDIVVAESGGMIYCLNEEGSYPLDSARVTEKWRLNFRESLSGASSRRNPFRRQMAAARLAARGKQIVLTSGHTLFVVDGDGTPLARRELTEPEDQDLSGGNRSAIYLNTADLDGTGRASVLTATAFLRRWDSHGGALVAYDLDRADQ